MISAVRRTVIVVLVAVVGCNGDSGNEPQTLVATLGDSITAGSPRWSPDPAARAALVRGRPTRASQWQYWAERAADGAFRFRNCGVEGDRTDEIALRFAECTDGAQVVVVQGGTNDLFQRRAPAAAAANIREMIGHAKRAGLRTLVTTAPPVNAGYPRWAPEVARLNERIRAIARQEGVTLVDFFELLEDPGRPARMPARWTADGLHPSIAGYARLGRAVAAELG